MIVQVLDVAVAALARRHLRLVVGREIRADELPRVAAGRGPHQAVGRVVDHHRVVLRGDDRRVPVEAQRLVAVGDALRFARVEVGPRERAELRLVVQVAVGQVHDVVEPVAAAHRLPVLEHDRPAAALAARPAHRPVVLQAAVHVVGHLVVEADGVELRQRQLVRVVPVLPAVEGDPHAVVVAEDHVLRVLRVDPERVVVAAEPERRRPGLPAVLGLEHADAQHVGVVHVGRVDPDVHVVVAGPAAHRVLLVHLPPRLPAVVGPVHLFADHPGARLALAQLLQAVGVRHLRLVGVLDVRVEHQRVLQADVEADAADHAAGEARRSASSTSSRRQSSCRSRCRGRRG